MKRGKIYILLVVFAVLSSACTSSSSEDEPVLVFAAASLTDAFASLQEDFELAHPEVRVEFNFAGSGLLREQISQGAPADIFASADLGNMETLSSVGLVVDPVQVFALNRMALAVSASNPKAITSLVDLERDDLLVGLCTAGVPCGDLARRLLVGAGISPRLATVEPNVRALANKIALDELDVGLVYVTDIVALAPVIEGVEIPDDDNFTTPYPIAVVKDAPHRQGAETFFDYVNSNRAAQILEEHGFQTPK